MTIAGRSSAILLALFICNATASAEENASAKLPVWSVSPKAAPALMEEVDGDWFSIRPPKGLERLDIGDTTAYDRAGVKVAVWTKEAGRAANPTITVMSLPPHTPGHDNRELFEGVLGALTAKWPNAKGSEITEGLWNDRPALRSQFSATDETGEQIRGVVLCDADESATFTVCVINSGDAEEDTIELMTLANSAVSCKLKSSRAR